MDHNDFLTCVSCYMVHPENEEHFPKERPGSSQWIQYCIHLLLKNKYQSYLFIQVLFETFHPIILWLDHWTCTQKWEPAD